MEELAVWLEALRVKRVTPAPVEDWLQRARDAVCLGETTGKVMARRWPLKKA